MEGFGDFFLFCLQTEIKHLLFASLTKDKQNKAQPFH